MTGNSEPTEKLRALFLATLMVFSVFAGATAFAGTAAAANTTAGNSDIVPNQVDSGTTNTHTITLDATDVDTSGDGNQVFVVKMPDALDLSSSQVSNTQVNDGAVTIGSTNVDSTTNFVNVTVQDDTSASGSTTSDDVSITYDLTNVKAPNVASNTNVDAKFGIDANADGDLQDGDDSALSNFQTLTVNSGSSFSDFNSPLPQTGTDNTPLSSSATSGASITIGDASFDTAGSVSNVTVNATAGSSGSITADSISTVTATVYNASSEAATQTVAYDAHNTTVEFDGTVSNVERIKLTAAVSNNAADGAAIDAIAYVATNPVGTWNTGGTQTVDNSQTGFISGRVSDQNNQDVQNATVTVENATTGFNKSTQTNSEGDYTIEVPDGTYDVTADKSGFSTAQPKDTTVEANSTTTANFVLRRLLLPDTLEATPDSTERLVGEEATFDVVVRDQNGDRLSGVTVDASVDNSDVAFVGGTAGTTDSNGETSFTVTSDNIVNSADVTFEVSSNNSISDVSTVSFTESGEGSLQGYVDNAFTTDPVEDASVWVVSEQQYETNQNHTQVDLSSISGATADSTVWIRLVDNETGNVVDKDDYDLRVAPYTNSTGSTIFADTGTAVRDVSELNTTDASVGNGYALIDQNGDGYVAFNHTRLLNEDYYAQVSLNATNASDDRIADTGTEAFVNVTDIDNAGANNPNAINEVSGDDIGTGNAAVFTPTANLTLAASEQRAANTTANSVDSPGFVNSYGFETDGTNMFGRFVLDRLSTDFQDGRTYVGIASKVGFTTDFADVYLTEDGETEFAENQAGSPFLLEPKPVDPDGVDIQQIGTKENNTASSPVRNFSDQTDATFQEVPRDGSTVDVFQINTTAEGTLVDANVTVNIGATNGDYVNIAGGQFIGDVDGDNTIELSTGTDGQATVWYQSDQDSASVQTQKTATLNADSSVSDFSNVEFVGVLQTEAAEVSGIVTDSNNDPVPSVVYTAEFRVDGNTFTLEPATVDLSEWRLERNNGDSAIISRSQAENYNFQTNITGAPAFPGVSIAPYLQGVTLVTESTSGVQESSSYTLPRVPSEGPSAFANDVVVRATSDGSIANANSISDFENGTAVRTDTEVNRTSTANVEISGAEAGTFTVNSVTASPNPAEQGDTVTVEAEVENVGSVTSNTDVTLSIGTDVANATEQSTVQSDVLAPGDADTVTFTVDTSGLAAGDYVHVVEASASEPVGTAQQTITNSSSNSNLDRFDSDDSGQIDQGEVIDAIDAFYTNSDVGGESVDQQDVLDVIDAFYTNAQT